MEKGIKSISIMTAFVLLMMIVFSGCQPGKVSTNSQSGPVKLLWYTIGQKQADQDMVMDALNKKLKEKLNIVLDLEPIDTGTYENKMNMIIAANENYDICFTSNWMNQFYPNVSRSAFMPLDDLIDKYAPKIRSVMPTVLFAPATVHGKLYAVPNYQIEYQQNGLYVNAELANKYNLNIKNIKELKDLEPFLENIKNNEPGIYPYRPQSLDPFTFNHEAIADTPGYVDRNDPTVRVHSRPESAEQKEYIDFLSDWFKKGYIRKDILTVTDDTVDVNNNKYAVLTGVVKPGFDAVLKVRTKKDYIPQPLEEAKLNAQSGISSMNAISANSKNPVQAIKLLELMNTDKEIFNILCFGIENVHYKKVSENQVEVIEDSKYKASDSAWLFGNQFNSFYMQGQKPGSWEETDRINREAKPSTLSGFIFDSEPVKIEVAQVSAVQKEYEKIWCGDWQSLYPAYIDKLKKAGLDKLLAEEQRQIDEWLKTKK